VVNNFKANRPYNSFLLFIYGLALCWSVLGKSMPIITNSQDGFLWQWMVKAMDVANQQYSVVFGIFVLMLVFFQTIVINQLVISQRLFSKVNYLTGMSFLILYGLFIQKIAFSSSLVSCTILLGTLYKICSLQNATNPKTTIFNIAISIGIASMFYFPAILFALVLLLSMIINRPFRMAEWLLMLVGFITPYYFFISVVFLLDLTFKIQFLHLGISPQQFKWSITELISVIILLLLLIAGIYFSQQNMRRLLVQSRKAWSLLILWFFIGATMPFFNSVSDYSSIFFIAPPLATILSAFFYYYPKNWVTLFFHWLLVGMTVINSIAYWVT
jgi:hypothetical protein